MAIFGLITPFRAAAVIAAVWVLSPHEPDIGFGRPDTIAGLVTQSASACVTGHMTCDRDMFDSMVESIAGMAKLRGNVLDAIERVRTDLRQNAARRQRL